MVRHEGMARFLTFFALVYVVLNTADGIPVANMKEVHKQFMNAVKRAHEPGKKPYFRQRMHIKHERTERSTLKGQNKKFHRVRQSGQHSDMGKRSHQDIIGGHHHRVVKHITEALANSGVKH